MKVKHPRILIADDQGLAGVRSRRARELSAGQRVVAVKKSRFCRANALSVGLQHGSAVRERRSSD
jgi:hypothetical protein